MYFVSKQPTQKVLKHSIVKLEIASIKLKQQQPVITWTLIIT